MAHVEADALHDPEPIALGRTLRQARGIEQVLTDAGVDYVVQVEAYGRSFLFGTVRHGAVFYVSTAQAAEGRRRLSEARLGKTVLEVQPAD